MQRVVRTFLAVLTSVVSAVFLSVTTVTPAVAAEPLTYVPEGDFTTYCQAHGYVGAELVAQNAYGWRCVSPSGEYVTFSVTAVCREVTVKDNSPTVLDFLYDFTDAGSRGWWCYRLSQVAPLGRLDVDRYCRYEGYDRGVLVGGDTALNWVCESSGFSTPLNSVDRLSIGCGRQYPSPWGTWRREWSTSSTPAPSTAWCSRGGQGTRASLPTTSRCPSRARAWASASVVSAGGARRRCQR